MKTILILSSFIFLIFSSGLNYSQELGWGAGEIYVGTYQQAESYDVIFQADGLASGIYFYTITSGNFMATKKLILLK